MQVSPLIISQTGMCTFSKVQAMGIRDWEINYGATGYFLTSFALVKFVFHCYCPNGVRPKNWKKMEKLCILVI